MTVVLRSRTVFVLAIVCLASTAAAQAPPPPPPQGTAVVRGRIVAADTGKPLRRARVSFSSIEFPGPPRSVTTNIDGRYEMTKLAAGRYIVSADRSGYLLLRYGQRRPLEPSKPLQVLNGQTVERVDFPLPRAGLIAGHIVDEVGDAVAGATVFAMRTEFWLGRRQLVPAGPASRTDDTGQFRITGLAPGAYLLRADTRETWTTTRGGKKQLMGFAPTYFPGTPDANVGQRVNVGLGQQIASIDFSLVPGRTMTVSGTAVDSSGKPLTRVTLVQNTVGPNGGMVGFPGNSLVAADGTFTIRDVLPGNYTIVAVGSNEIARSPVVVAADADVDNIALTAKGGWSIAGIVTTESGAPPSLPVSRVRISANMLAAVAGARVQGEPDYTQKLNDDWTFSVGGITGPARIRVGLPDGWAVKSIFYKGRDLVDATLEPSRGDEPMSGVEIVLTDRVTTVSGQLVDRQGAPLDGTIVVFSTDSAKLQGESRYVRSTRPDQLGQFQIKGLPAGDYLAVALDYVQDGAWNDPEYLESIRRYGERFTLTDGGSTTIAPKLVTP